ncbi:MAG: M23 family metallopeptidase [Xanthobacteraceae bacterium]|nr:M23 family metallopeptidase [Xanthobacteraceae bacterium]
MSALLHLPPIDLHRGLHWFADRFVIPRTWLVAKLLLIVGAGVAMIVSAHVFLGEDVRIAGAAMMAHLDDADAFPRADRLAVAAIADIRDPIKSSIEQIDDRGIGTRQFTHVIAPLMRAPLNESTAQNKKVLPVVASAPSPRPQVLPNEIRLGSSHVQTLPDRARAYAAAGADDVWRPSAVADGVPINLTVVTKTEHDGSKGLRRLIVARKGDTLDQILGVLGVDPRDAHQIQTLLTPLTLFGARSFSGGEKIVVEFSNNRTSLQPLRISLYRNGRHGTAAALTHDGGYVMAVAPPPEFQPSTEVLNDAAMPSQPSALRDSLYAVAHAAHIARAAISDVIAACANDLDMAAPASVDGKAELLYSSDDQGKPVVVYAAVRSEGKTDRYYRFLAPDDASAEYYDADGRAVPRPYLRVPVANGKLGDGFGWRIHPVLHDRRFHEGVDYAAPLGSPIMVAADGVVTKIDREWGYGKYIRIRHDARFETTYAHIAGVAGGLQVGDHVRQGQTIAYVGSTGLSTGPHLYYEMRVDGRDVDPLHTNAISGHALVGTALADFKRIRERVDTLLLASMPTNDKP